MMTTSTSDTSSNNNNSSSSTTPIFDLMMSQYHSSTLVVFGRMKLFDFIHNQTNGIGVSVEQIAKKANWSIRATSAMCVSLVANDILEVDNGNKDNNEATVHSFEHRYRLTQTATRFLLSDQPGTVLPYLELFWDFSPQKLLDKSSATKKQDNFMLETSGEGAPSEMFINAMQGQTSHAAMVLAPLLCTTKGYLSDITHFVDVGGGSGTFCIEICKNLSSSSSKQLKKGSIYELKGVCPITDKYIQKAGIPDVEIQTIPGNMFEDELFPKADCYGFGNVLHDWSDEANIGLVEKAYKSLDGKGEGGEGKIVLLEMLLNDENLSKTTKAAAGLNLVMVTNEDGRQYKFNELKTMLEDVGFVDVDVVSLPNQTPYSAIIGTKNK